MFNPPTLEDLQETRRANEKLVLEALDSKPEWVETELAKTTGLALSHLRAALASLLDQGRVRRLPGTGTRAVYGLADPGLADVPATPLTEDALRIREYLEGRADSALYMSNELRLTREEIMAALSLLNAHGMITCTFVGSLVIFRLKEQQALEAPTPAEVTQDAEPAAKTAAKKSGRKAASAKADEDAEGEAEPAPKRTKKASTKVSEAKATADTGADSEADPDKPVAKQTPAKKAPAKKAAAKAESVSTDAAGQEAAPDKAPEKAPSRKRVTAKS